MVQFFVRTPEYPELCGFDLIRLRSVYPAGMDPMGRGEREKSRNPALPKIRDTLIFLAPNI